MRTSKKNNAGNQLEVRSLKIQPIVKFNRASTTTVPEITLSGRWLENLGFKPNERVSVTTEKKLLIIRLDE